MKSEVDFLKLSDALEKARLAFPKEISQMSQADAKPLPRLVKIQDTVAGRLRQKIRKG